MGIKMEPAESPFQEFLYAVAAIEQHEPLAATLGAFKDEEGTLSYRKEQALFPMLEKHEITEPPEIRRL